MIVIKNGASAHWEAAVLRSMFEARKQVFVDLLGWNVPVIDNRFEVDQFDDAHATYVIVADDNGAHLGSARLLKTTRAHILGDLFPELCASEVPRAPDTFEIAWTCAAAFNRERSGHARAATRPECRYHSQAGFSRPGAPSARAQLTRICSVGKFALRIS